MWSSFSRLLIGFVLLGLTGWFLTYVAHGWDHTWQREQAAVAKSKSVSLIDPTLANDPSIAPAKVKVIGPLASAMQHEQDDVNGTDNTAIAESASSAQPTAFDHVERPSTTAPRRFHSTFLVKGYRYYQLLGSCAHKLTQASGALCGVYFHSRQERSGCRVSGAR